jgi:hypothetical protein
VSLKVGCGRVSYTNSGTGVSSTPEESAEGRSPRPKPSTLRLTHRGESESEERKGERQRAESPSLVIVGVASTLECENKAFRLLG